MCGEIEAVIHWLDVFNSTQTINTMYQSDVYIAPVIYHIDLIYISLSFMYTIEMGMENNRHSSSYILLLINLFWFDNCVCFYVTVGNINVTRIINQIGIIALIMILWWKQNIVFTVYESMLHILNNLMHFVWFCKPY